MKQNYFMCRSAFAAGRAVRGLQLRSFCMVYSSYLRVSAGRWTTSRVARCVRSSSPFVFTLGEGSVIKGLDIDVASKKKEEVAKFTQAPEYAYGNAGSPPRSRRGQRLFSRSSCSAGRPRMTSSMTKASSSPRSRRAVVGIIRSRATTAFEPDGGAA